MTLSRILILLVLIAAPMLGATRAEAYPAVSSTVFGCGSGYAASCPVQGGTPSLMGPYGSAQAACTSINAAYYNGGAGGVCGVDSVGNGQHHCKLQFGAGPCAPQFVAGEKQEWTCPSGGTLQGNQCVCPEGHTDTGSSCTAPEACAGDEFRRTATEPCEKKCPVQQGNGPHWFPSGVSRFCAVRKDYATEIGYYDTLGLGVDPEAGIRCMYKAEGRSSICADVGEGMKCETPVTVGIGEMCGAAWADPQEDPPECAQGDMYCRTSGLCPQGFVGGEFNGERLCVKQGEAVSVVPRKDSSLVPPGAPTPPPVPTDPATGQPVEVDPNKQVVVAIGPGAGAGGVGNPGGGGGGGGGTGDVITCGLPNTPKCKIDETGTPTGSGAFNAADAAADSARDALKGVPEQVVGNKDDTSWGFGISLPTGCTNPPALVLPRANLNWTADLCQFEPEIHAVMTFLWALLTLGGITDMVRRTVAGG